MLCMVIYCLFWGSETSCVTSGILLFLSLILTVTHYTINTCYSYTHVSKFSLVAELTRIDKNGPHVNGKGLHLYSTFLVLVTTQRTLHYMPFTHSPIHTYIHTHTPTCGRFTTLPKDTGGAGIWTTNLPISEKCALPPEP